MSNIEILNKHFLKSNSAIDNKISCINAVIYTRVSTREQAMTNHSLETQLKKCRELGESKGYNIIKEFGNTYESAKTDDRKEFQLMLEFIRKTNKGKAENVISIIIIYSFDRFSRSGSFTYVDELKKLGVRLQCVNYDADTSTKEGRLTQSLSFIIAQFENEGRAEKSVAGTRQLLLNGGWPSKPTQGYDKIDGPGKSKVCIINDEGRLIAKAFKMKAQGVPNVEILKWLNVRGLVLYPQKLTKIFKNLFYCGIIKHGTLPDQLVKGTHQSVVSEEQFMIVNGISSNYLKSSHKKEDDNYPLKSTILCEKCGGKLTGYQANGKLAKYYKCNTRGCGMNININIVHETLINNLKSLSINEIYIAPIKYQLELIIEEQNKVNKNEAAALLREIKRLEDEIYQIVDTSLFSDKGVSAFEKHIDVREKKKSEAQAEYERLNKNLSNLKGNIDGALKLSSDFGKIWQNGTLFIRRNVQNLLFPKGLIFSKENRNYRTEHQNAFYTLISSISECYDNEKRGQISVNSNLSPLVARRGIEPLFLE